LRAVANSHFGENIGHVIFHRVFGQIQGAGDFLVAFAVGYPTSFTDS